MQPLFKGLSINIRGAENNPDKIRNLCPDLDFTPEKRASCWLDPNGTVTLRWYGSSNGYYATDVEIKEIMK